MPRDTIKPIDAASSVTTNTTDTFTAPSASNARCCMKIINFDTADTITLDTNAKFKTAVGLDLALGPDDVVEVCATRSTWYQASTVAANQQRTCITQSRIPWPRAAAKSKSRMISGSRWWRY